MELRGKEIYTLDMTFSESVTRQLIRDNIRVTSIDHHISSKAVTEMTQQYSYALDHSGAVLAWQYFHPDTPVPRMLLSVEDMDLWHLKIPGTAELYAYLDLFDFDFSVWSDLVADFEDDAKRATIIEMGAIVVRHENKVIEKMIAKYAHQIMLGDTIAYAINASSAFRTQMGHVLADRSPSGIGIVWWETSDGNVAVSLRGVGDADVAALAERYGGGGHKHAAGFRVNALKEIPWKNI